MEYKALKFELKEVSETGVFDGYGATFSSRPDSYGDIIEPGAFAKTLTEQAGRIKILWQHDTWSPIGIPQELREDSSGLYVKGKLSLGVQKAREAFELVKDGVISELSIGYETIKDEVIDNVRHLREIRLFDISLVTFAANPEALVLSAKLNDKLAQLETAKAGRLSEAKLRAAIDALSALIDSASTPDDEEPAKATPIVDAGAARLKAMLESMTGYDVSEASKRIDAMLAKLNT